jgi:NitT/TauT family transport system substrate-binding protein
MRRDGHSKKNFYGAALIAAILALACAAAARPALAEEIKIGVQKVVSVGAIYIAQEKGYFAAEGLTAEIVYFDAPEAIPAAVVSGDLDIGVGTFSAGFYSLAGQGALRIIAANLREYPGFQAQVIVASKGAYEAGLNSFDALPGHSVAVAQIGGPGHYTLSLLAAKHHFDLKSLRILPLQTNPNAASAVIGGRADAAAIPTSAIKPAIQSGDVKVIGWVGDEVPWQLGAVFATAKTADTRGDMLERFLRAFRKGIHEFHDAFADENDKRRDGPTAPDVIAIISKYSGQTPAQVQLSIISFDREARLDVKDVLRQIAWYKSEGLLKGEIDGDTIIDKRYVIPLPQP